MLVLNLAQEESVLARDFSRDLWELTMTTRNDEGYGFRLYAHNMCVVAVKKRKSVVFSKVVERGFLLGFRADVGDRVFVGDVCLHVCRRHNSLNVKLAIDGPDDVRYSRPRDHGRLSSAM